MKRSTQGVQRLVGRKIYYEFNVHTVTAHHVYEQNDGSYVTALGAKDGGWFMFRGIDPFGSRGNVKLLDFCKFDINRKRGVITAIVGWKGRTYAGTAVYNPKDNFDPAFGRKLALYRALMDPSAEAAEIEKLESDVSDVADVIAQNQKVNEALAKADEASEASELADEMNNSNGGGDCP